MKRFAAGLALLWALLVTGTPAFAHAVLVASDPAAGARVETAPRAVTLTFDEGVETNLGSLRVLDAAGYQRSTGAVVHPDGDQRRVAVHLNSLQRGRYVVAWEVISADSHLVNGAFAFGVGEAAGDAPVLPADNGAKLLLPILHFAMLAGALLGIGLPIGVLALARTARRGAGFVEFAAWLVLAFAAFGDVAFRADLAGGSLGSAFGTHVGLLRTVTIAAAFIGVLSIAAKERRWPVLACAAAVTVASLSLAGHAGDGNVLAAGADMLHFTAAAAWIGVLAIGSTLEAGPELRGISPVALGAVTVLIVTGIIQSLRTVGSFAALIGTTYGRIVDMKIALLIALLAVAFGARRALARGTFAIATGIKLELWLLAAVIALTAVLVEQPLPRELAPPAAATATFALNGSTIDVTASGTDAREWTIRVSASGPIDAADVSVSETQRKVGPLAVPMQRLDAQTFSGTIALPFAGKWTAYASVRSGAFDEAHHTITLPETTP